LTVCDDAVGNGSAQIDQRGDRSGSAEIDVVGVGQYGENTRWNRIE
jgi:hypothetical protein